ncbi:MAG: heat-inducible transcription repressor HrcA [bacterium]|nr:heat-inducible transcription repressor HrcA [bacterium]
MAGKPQKTPAEKTLAARQVEVLRAIIRQHLVSGEPVASKSVLRGVKLDLSAASIRSVMAELEERGLLEQPHTSAGRVPTDTAYRLYVDEMIRPRMTLQQAQAIDDALERSRGDVPEMLSEASRQLSQFSNQVGLVLSPEIQRVIVKHLEFVRLDAKRVVSILVAGSGVVYNRVLDVDEALTQGELDRIGRQLTEEICGRTLPEMRDLLMQRLSEDQAAYDQLLARALRLGQQAVSAEGLDPDVIVEGTANLIESPEFADLDVLRGLMRTLDEKKTLVGLLGRVLGGDGGPQVVIGEESHVSDLASCSLIASNYGVGDRVVGTVGIVGPRRMEYARTIALVDHLAQALSRMLFEADN